MDYCPYGDFHHLTVLYYSIIKLICIFLIEIGVSRRVNRTEYS